ncbi:hypothetical protein AWW66_31790 [Micromonospora rosaria]|uniref:Uncharacterized protein n=1 Tax=Micromonospora rosaria TaxID=47874 RepID=A0A136PI91_9ACTN|nr:hypothetical protein AWW66_31790 [Micromonospora rosaria]
MVRRRRKLRWRQHASRRTRDSYRGLLVDDVPQGRTTVIRTTVMRKTLEDSGPQRGRFPPTSLEEAPARFPERPLV